MGSGMNIQDLPGRALKRRGIGGGGWICHAAGGFRLRAMSGEGWAAGDGEGKVELIRSPSFGCREWEEQEPAGSEQDSGPEGQ